MSTIGAFVLGLIVGWVIEWIIDWVYWRHRIAEMTRRLEIAESSLSKQAEIRKSERSLSDLESQLTKLKSENSSLQEKVAAFEAQQAAFQAPAVTAAAPPEVMAADLEKQPAQINLEPPQVKTTELPAIQDEAPSEMTPPAVHPDDLIVIKGIGPVISRKLNEAGIFTFRELAAITPERLREIVGNVIQQLANEEDILDQAKKLAADQDRAANS
jgi:predicted flap endonuclease-1-like 5' DNA nuclease